MNLDHLAGRHDPLDRVEEADELLIADKAQSKLRGAAWRQRIKMEVPGAVAAETSVGPDRSSI